METIDRYTTIVSLNTSLLLLIFVYIFYLLSQYYLLFGKVYAFIYYAIYIKK